jgi:hypothetical protein
MEAVLGNGDAFDILSCDSSLSSNLLDCVVADMYGERARAPIQVVSREYHRESYVLQSCREFSRLSDGNGFGYSVLQH